MKPWACCLLWLVLSLGGAAVALSACGQKGDLYLPEESPKGEPEKR